MSSGDRLWCVLSHISGIVGFGIRFPLVVYLVMRRDSPAVAHHARPLSALHPVLAVGGRRRYLRACLRT